MNDPQAQHGYDPGYQFRQREYANGKRIAQHGNWEDADLADREQEASGKPQGNVMPTPLDDRLATIQKESGDLWLQLGQKEYARRVLDAEIVQLSQRIALLSQEADALKRASASSG